MAHSSEGGMHCIGLPVASELQCCCARKWMEQSENSAGRRQKGLQSWHQHSEFLTWEWLHSKLPLVLRWWKSLHRGKRQCHRMRSWNPPMPFFFSRPLLSSWRTSPNGISDRGRKCSTGHFQSLGVKKSWTVLCISLLSGAGPSGYIQVHGNLIRSKIKLDIWLS